MKKKTLKGLVIGLSIAGTVVAGVSAVSIMTKGFTDYENLKIKPRGEVVERFVWDEDEGRFANENLQDLDESTILEYLALNNEYRPTLVSTIASDIENSLSLSEREEIKSLTRYTSGSMYGVNINLFGYMPSAATTYWHYGVDDQGVTAANNHVLTSVEYDYFDTVRVYFDGMENDMIAVYDSINEDGANSADFIKVKKDKSIQASYVDLEFIQHKYTNIQLLCLKDDSIQTEPIKIGSIELVNLDTTVEENATTFFNWAIEAA